MNNKDGYAPGASEEMAVLLQIYKRAPLVNATKERGNKVSGFYWREYESGQKIPPSKKKAILDFLRDHIQKLQDAIKLEESRVPPL